MAPPVAIITGASSGIGLALARNLISLQWNVVIADINPPKESLPDTLFIQTDISSWDQQVNMFQQAYTRFKRLDFCALNAGIDDRDDIFGALSYDVTRPPRRPNIKTFSVNLIGTYYGVKLAAHFMTISSSEAGKPKSGGKIVLTSSGAGLFPIPAIPQYTASKHALVGLVRALGASKAALEANVRINALCPAIVATGFPPPGLLDQLPVDQITPMATILRCYNALADLQHVTQDDWVEKGRTGETVEGNMQELIWHDPPARPEAEGASKYVREKGTLAAAEAYRERNRRFAAEDEQN